MVRGSAIIIPRPPKLGPVVCSNRSSPKWRRLGVEIVTLTVAAPLGWRPERHGLAGTPSLAVPRRRLFCRRRPANGRTRQEFPERRADEAALPGWPPQGRRAWP